MENPLFILEACVETIQQAINAEKKGAHQIEFCRDLKANGLTPLFKEVKQLKSELSIPIKLIIRPRPGNFIYTKDEVEKMKSEIYHFSTLGMTEFVLGALQKDTSIDMHCLSSITSEFPEIHICFHKAIDECRDLKTAITLLKRIPQVKSILSSGKANTAWEGRHELIRMLNWCGDDIQLIVAGKVTRLNLSKIHECINASHYHGRKIVGDL